MTQDWQNVSRMLLGCSKNSLQHEWVIYADWILLKWLLNSCNIFLRYLTFFYLGLVGISFLSLWRKFTWQEFLSLFVFSYNRYFSKGANQWRFKYVKEQKTYSYISQLIVKILSEYCNFHKERPLYKKRELEADDPRRLAENVAPLEAPATLELVAQRQSRLKSSWPKPGTSKDEWNLLEVQTLENKLMWKWLTGLRKSQVSIIWI